MEKIGIDLGNGYTKYGNKKFASRVRLGKSLNIGDKSEDVFDVVYNGISYIVGEGEIFTTDKRIYGEDYLLCLFTAIANSTPDKMIEADICVGLPIIKYMSPDRTKLEEHLKGKNGITKITVDGIEKVISIRDVVVFMEGAYVIESKEKRNVVTIDIGAGTVNIIQWENQRPIKYDTKSKSFYNLHGKIANHLKQTGRGDVPVEYIEQNLGASEIFIDQKMVDISDTHHIIRKHISELASSITNDFDLSKAVKIQLLGGGAIPTMQYWQDILGDGVEIVPDGQFVNAKIYQKVINEPRG